ncbi:MAG: DUF4159 domain-containing protein [Granulosicoccus sp.]
MPYTNAYFAAEQAVVLMLKGIIGRIGAFSSMIAAVLSALIVINNAHAQMTDSRIDGPPTAEFHFARLIYANAPGSRRALRGWGQAWMTDYADAEYHLMKGVNRLIRIDGQDIEYNGNGGRLITLDDERIFDYPWLYAVEVGQWYLSDSEASLLREYLDRGGFLLVDDFWGQSEWSIFVQSLERVFPDRPVVDLPEEHEISNIHFEIKQRAQIPGRNGSRPGTTPQWRAILDDDGRVVVAINFNMDMGDAWEHADDPYYPAEMTGLAYRFTMNYIVYSLTH